MRRVHGLPGMIVLLLVASCTHSAPHALRSYGPTPSPSSSPAPSPRNVPWIDAPAPPPAPTLSQRGVRRCVATELAGSYINSAGAAGNDINFLAIRNIGRRSCFVEGRPHVRLITTDGRTFPWSSGATYFPDYGAIEILLAPGTTVTTVDSEISTGQATLGFTYFDCANDHIAEAVIRFGGQQFTVAIPKDVAVPTGAPACNGSTVQKGPVQTSANNFEPPAPQSPLGSVNLAIYGPDHVTAGTRLLYQLSISNMGSRALRFGTSCPGYVEILGNARVSVTLSYRLNCANLTIAPGEYEQFDMVLDVPKSFHGLMTLNWFLLPKRSNDDVYASTLVTVTDR